MNTLFGFGGFKISCGSMTANFEQNTGHLMFRKVSQNWITRDGNEHQRFLGWIPEISVIINNLTDSQSTSLSELVDILNQHTLTNTPLTIAPRYDYTNDYGLSFDCNIASDFNPEDIAACEAGQSIPLYFIGIESTKTMPNVFSGTQIHNVVDYLGVQIVTASQENVIAKY